MGSSDYGVDLMYFWLGNLFRMYGGAAAGTGRYGGLGRLKSRARTWRQLRTVGISMLGLHVVFFV